MAMFDDVDKKLSGWFNAGAEKAKGMSETLRLSNAIREEETKQAELYRQMGKYFYDYFAVAAEGKMKEWCDGVKASQQQVQVYKEQIQTLKGTVSCPNCGAEVSSGSAFCNVCGTKIEHKVPKASAGRICPVCGASVPESAAFCTSCGTKIPAVMEEAKSAPAVSTEKRDARTAEMSWRTARCSARYVVQRLNWKRTGSSFRTASAGRSGDRTAGGDRQCGG